MTDEFTILHDYHAIHDSGSREAPCIAYITMHDAEDPDALTAAEDTGAWFQNKASQGSAHYGCDDNSIQEYLNDDREAWGDVATNDSGLHIEQLGLASWSRATWLKHDGLLRRSGWLVARKAKQYAIPLVLVKTADLKKFGRNPKTPKGVTAHMWTHEAFGLSSHTDPGSGYPFDVMMDYAKQYATPVQEDNMGSYDDDQAAYEDRFNELVAADSAGQDLGLEGAQTSVKNSAAAARRRAEADWITLKNGLK